MTSAYRDQWCAWVPGDAPRGKGSVRCSDAAGAGLGPVPAGTARTSSCTAGLANPCGHDADSPTSKCCRGPASGFLRDVRRARFTAPGQARAHGEGAVSGPPVPSAHRAAGGRLRSRTYPRPRPTARGRPREPASAAAGAVRRHPRHRTPSGRRPPPHDRLNRGREDSGSGKEGNIRPETHVTRDSKATMPAPEKGPPCSTSTP